MVKFLLNPASSYNTVTAHIPVSGNPAITFTAVWSKDGYFNQTNDAYGMIPKYLPITPGDTLPAVNVDTVTIIYGSSNKFYYNSNDPNYFIQIKKSYEVDSLKLFQVIAPDTTIILEGDYTLTYDNINHYDLFNFTNFTGSICSYPQDYIFNQDQNGMIETIQFVDINDECSTRKDLLDGINYNTRPLCPSGQHYDDMLGYCVLNSNPSGIPDWSIMNDSLNEYHMTIKVSYPEWHPGLNDTAFISFYYNTINSFDLPFPADGFAPVLLVAGQGFTKVHIPVNENSAVSIIASWSKDSTLKSDMNARSEIIQQPISYSGFRSDTALLTLVFNESEELYIADLDSIMGFFKMVTLIDADSFYIGTSIGKDQIKRLVSSGITSFTYNDQLQQGQINFNGSGGLCGTGTAQYPFTYNNDIDAIYFYPGIDPCSERDTLLKNNWYYRYDTTKCPVNYVKDKYGRCYLRPTCPEGYVWDAMSSSCIPQCGKDYYWDGYQCRPNREVKNGCPNDTVLFQVIGALQSTWHFGDSTANASGTIVKHIYKESGVYNAFALVKNGCNRPDTLYAKVVIDNSGKPGTDMDLSFYQGIVNDTLFTTYYDNDNRVDNNKYLWLFGDGNTSNEREPYHIYQTPGNYTISLQVTNGCGTSVGQRTVTIMPSGKEIINEPYADAGKDTIIRGGQSVMLDGTNSKDVSGGNKITYNWTSLDNMTLDNPTSSTPVFSAPFDINKDFKDYIFILTVTDIAAGKTSSDFVVVTVNKPAGDYCGDPAIALPGLNRADFYRYSYESWFVYYPPTAGILTISNCGKSDQNTQLYFYNECYNNSIGYFSNTCGNNVSAEINVVPENSYLFDWNVSTSGGELAKAFDFDLTFKPFGTTDFISYSIPGQIGNSEIDYNNKKITISMDPAYSLTGLIPHFELQSGSRAEIGGIIQQSDSSIVDFSSVVTYLVTNDIDSANWTVEISLVSFGGTDCYSAIPAVEGINYAQFYDYYEIYDQWYYYTPNHDGLLEINLCEENSMQPLSIYLNVFEDSCNNYTDYIYPYTDYCNNTNNYYFLVKKDILYLFDLNNYFSNPTNFAWTLKFYPCGAKASVNWSYSPDNLYLTANANMYTENDTSNYIFEWDLGDGTILNNTFNIQHQYPGPGTYKAKFIVTNKSDLSCSDTAKKEIFIAVPIPIYVSSQYGDDMNGDGSIIRPYSSIGYAIQQSIYGTDIMVLPGIYNEELYIENKSIQIKSTSGPENTTITEDNDQSYNIDIYGSYYSSAISLDGFTLNNALYSAIYSSGTSLKISNCIISSPQQGILVYGGESMTPVTVNINRCLIKNCGSEGIQINYLPGVQNIINCTIVNNGWDNTDDGSGIYVQSTNINLHNCIIVNNRTGINYFGPDTIVVKGDYNDLWNNFINYNNVNAGTHSISGDPLFTDTVYYNLTHNSPCIDAGDPAYPLDPDGTTIDLGYRPGSAISGVEWVMLQKGWNIFSVYLQPESPSMISSMQQLIDKGVLIKVMDEQGNAIEAASYWNPNISELLLSEGYMIKLSANDTLIITGWQAPLPFSIFLNKGWNIMGYPLDIEQDAWLALDNLVTTNNLIKVQDERGYAIENVNPIGWINNIGNFKPGEGYKVKVLNDATLLLNTPLQKSLPANNSVPAQTPVHFKTIWTGNGFDQMNIYVLHSLMPGSEIAIYDGSDCVAAGVVTSGNQLLSLVASQDDPETLEKDGFNPGDKLKVILWDASTGKSGMIENYSCLNSTKPVFEAMGTIVISLISKPTGVVTPELITSLGDNYPNPFKHETTIKYTLGKEEKVSMEVYNLLGERVKVLVNETMNQGGHTVTWNCEDENGLTVPQGIYFYTMKADDYSAVKRMILLE